MLDRASIDAMFDRQRQAIKQRRPLGRQHQQPKLSLRYGDTYSVKEPPERELPYLPQEQVVRVLGLDLGQVHDPAAMVLCCRRKPDPEFVGPTYSQLNGLKQEPVEVEWIKEWPRGTPYDIIAEAALNLHVTVGEHRERVHVDALVFDMTGAGIPFRDFLVKRARELRFPGRCVGINLASSDTALKVRGDSRGKYMTVAKLEMLTAVNIFNQQRLLLLPQGAGTKKLLAQMQTFQPKKTAAAKITFEQGGAGHHGDVVIALGLCCWYMQKGFRELDINTFESDDPTLEQAWGKSTMARNIR